MKKASADVRRFLCMFLSLSLCSVVLNGCSGSTPENPSETPGASEHETESRPDSEETSSPEGQNSSGQGGNSEQERRFGRGEMWSREYDTEAFQTMYSAEIPAELIPAETITLKVAGVNYDVLKNSSYNTPKNKDNKDNKDTDDKKDNNNNKDRNSDTEEERESYVLTGEFAEVLKERFHVELEFVSDEESADLIFFEPTARELHEAAKDGKLAEFEASGLLDRYGAYLKSSDAAMLARVRTLVDLEDGLYGVGTMAGYGNESFSCEHNLPVIRFDVYEKIGSPEIRTLEDLPAILKQMVGECPKNDQGKKTYAVSYSKEWDGEIPFFLRTTANLYGYEEWGLGFYNVGERRFEELLLEDGIGLRVLRFYNRLYRTGLIDPNSETQSALQAEEKLANGTAMWNPDPTTYNTEEHLEKGQAMLPLPADDFSICDLALAPWMPEKILCISAASENRELCMAFVNWLASPEGCMSARYGKQGVSWDYDEMGVPFLTEAGKATFRTEFDSPQEQKEAEETDSDPGRSLGRQFSLWAGDAGNPQTAGFTYNAADWPSVVSEKSSKVERDWSTFTGYASPRDLLVFEEQIVLKPYSGMMVFPAVPEDLNSSWRRCAEIIAREMEDILHANSDDVFEINVRLLRKHLKQAGYEDCLQYCEEAASIRKSSEAAMDRMLVWPEAEDLPTGTDL